MRVWYFSEMAYHPAWEEGLKRGSLRVVLPSANYDPKIGHQLLNRYLDEFRLCDEVGLDIMVNEHHSTSTCLTISVPMALAVIARETKRARLLSLGTPIANRPDPVRVAEEMAWLDVLSGGRLEMDRARPRASRRRKSKAVAGGQGRALGDRSADPVCEKRQDPLGRSNCGNRGEHQGVRVRARLRHCRDEHARARHRRRRSRPGGADRRSSLGHCLPAAYGAERAEGRR